MDRSLEFEMSASPYRIIVPVFALLFAAAFLVPGERNDIGSFTLIGEANAQVKSSVSRVTGFKRSNRKFRNNQRIKRQRVRINNRRSDRLFIQRRRDIARRNERVVIENALQSARRSNSVLANPGRRLITVPSIGDAFGTRSGNSGVIIRGNKRDRLFIERRRDIARRNERVVLENELQSARRSGAVLARSNRSFSGSLVLDPREGVLSSGFEDGGTAGIITPYQQSCPSNHDCGYRLYTDGTGPRIITPVVPASDDLPEYDGISGSLVIQFDE